MSSIDVEAVESVEDEALAVDAPEYVLYGGKGGVGKTTMAAATALASARDGVATLAVSTDPAHSLSDSLGTDIPAEPTRIREDVPLYAAEIDPDAMTSGPFAEGGEGGGMLGGLDALMQDEGLNPFAAGTMPGADEAAAMQLLLQYMDDERFDRVVVDTAPTGHTLRLLELPELMESLTGRLLAFRERLSGMMGSVKGLFGAGADEESIEQGMDDLRVLADRVERLRERLRDPARTDFRVVMVPEEMSVVESEHLLERLRAFEIPVGTVVVNRVMQDLADVTDMEADWFVAPDLENCEFCQRRWQVQRSALSRAQDVFRGHDVKRVPLFADEVRGERMLRVVAACLA
ncbi:ArsA family ATPase [Haloglomus litoreum]|uniref:ArsA family ATPase n=1 Tax=Haloglomus litoreum TaxID=3034026 RepID=UPI0023E7B227|nr:TRC40/GET3/ArsA family transport-energizing ATPase [Haloglomus sp. DT116]